MTAAIASIQIDHQRFAALLECLAASVDDLNDGAGEANADLLHSIIDYIESFLDQFHHPKEDEYLFRILRRRSPEAEEMLSSLREEHYQGRRRLERLVTALRDFERNGQPVYEELRAAAGGYVAFERQHIAKEERDVLPLARQVLRLDDWREINDAFAANSDPLFGDDRKRKYELLFNAIAHMAPPPFGRSLPPRPRVAGSGVR